MKSQVKAWLDAIDGDEKFVMTLGAGMVNTALVIFGVIDPTTYRDLTVATVGAFILGSAYAQGVKYKAEASNAPDDR